MTPEEKAFINAMWADPTDDTARLVYADWLDEQEGRAGRCVRDAADSWVVLFWLGIVGEFFPTPGNRQPLSGTPDQPNNPDTAWFVEGVVQLTDEPDRTLFLVPLACRFYSVEVRVRRGPLKRNTPARAELLDRWTNTIWVGWREFTHTTRFVGVGPEAGPCDGLRLLVSGPPKHHVFVRIRCKFPRPQP